MSKVTYGRLDEVLRSLGFSVQNAEKKARLYTEENTGAFLALPALPADMEVLPRHLLAVRTTLTVYGIADETDLLLRLHEVT